MRQLLWLQIIIYSLSCAHTTYFGPIVHLFEWKFDDIATECESFLASNGYGAVQVSPVAECIILKDRPWYERYQPISYQICSRSGNENSFKSMVDRCKKVGIKIIVDVVLNHMTANNQLANGVCGSTAITNELKYPAVPYNKDDFNLPTCQIHDYNNDREVRVCELQGLHDLNTTKSNVRDKIIKFLNHLIELGVAGFRVDAAKHMWPEDLKFIYNQLNNDKVKNSFPDLTKAFIYQEVIDFSAGNPYGKIYSPLGLVTDFKYGQELSRSFRGNNPLKWFKNFGPAWDLLPSNIGLVFVDNHDNQRGHGVPTLTFKEARQYKMAVAFMLSWPHGYPRVMSSYYFTDGNAGPPHDRNYRIKNVQVEGNICKNGWICEHRWRQIYNMAKFRKVVQGSTVSNWWDNGNNQIAFCRGNKGFIAFNVDSYDFYSHLQTCLPQGKYCDVISGDIENGRCSGKMIIVDQNGFANISIQTKEFDGVLAIHQKSKI